MDTNESRIEKRRRMKKELDERAHEKALKKLNDLDANLKDARCDDG